MPTYEVPAAFRREYERLPEYQRRRFLAAVAVWRRIGDHSVLKRP